MLTITLPNLTVRRVDPVVFIVNGMSNPKFAASTSDLQISTMKKGRHSNQYTRLDSMLATVTATPGLLLDVNLSVEDPTVAAFSPLTVSVTPAHSVPRDGKIVVEMPKWNSFASD